MITRPDVALSIWRFCLDTDRRELRRGAALVPVEPQVFDILSTGSETGTGCKPGRSDRRNLGWTDCLESALTTRINAARNAIGDNGQVQLLIKTFPRKGIRFVGVVYEEKTEAGQATPRS